MRATPPAAEGSRRRHDDRLIRGTAGDRLLSGTAEIAGRVELHEMKMVDGVMKMRPLANGVEVPANGTVELVPGSSTSCSWT